MRAAQTLPSRLFDLRAMRPPGHAKSRPCCELKLRSNRNTGNSSRSRASSGSIFRLPVFRGELSELKLTLFGAAGDAGDTGKLAKDVDWRGPCAIVIGSEGQGLSEAVRKATQPVRIPTQGVESLNAAIAAAVFLYEAARQRGEAE